MYSAAADTMPLASGKKIKSFFKQEIDNYLKEHNCSSFDREGLKDLITFLHNGIEPSETTLSLLFGNSNDSVDPDVVLNALTTSITIPDVTIKPNDIFPESQTKIIPFKAPDLSTVRYNDNNFVSYKQGYIKKSQKSLFGSSYNVRYGILNKDQFVIYEKDTKEKVANEINLVNITSIEINEVEKGVYSFILHEGENEVILGCEDELSRKDWIKRIASLILLRMVSSGYINDTNFMKWIEYGANVNACYGNDDSRPILYYLLKYKKQNLASWLIKRGASVNCLLRWQFVVQERVLSPMELLTFMQNNNIPITTKSDDGFNYNIMYYMCYFGVLEGVNKLMENPEYHSILNDPTDSNDIALTITLLSPIAKEETKVAIAARICNASNLSICNRSSQNPIQLLMLMGKVNLLFRLLPLSVNVRQDQYNNSMLHLAIKAGLKAVSRYILRFNNFGDINQLDNAGDSVFSLAIKSGDEALACEILKEGGNPAICSPNWRLANSEKDLAIHQALKRNMPTLSNLILESGEYFLSPDTEGNLPIHLAFIHHIPACIDFMLAHPSVSTFINSANTSDQYTPLHLAILYGSFNHAEQLLELHANVNVQTNVGYTPCHVLVKYARGDYDNILYDTMSADQINQLCMDILKQTPDLTKCCNEQSETCLHMAIRGGILTEELALLFLQYDPQLVNIRDFEQCTPLVRAVEIRNIRLVQALCDFDANLDVVNVTHNTPLHIAVMNGDIAIVQYLVNKHASLRVWNRDGVYPMHIAIQKGFYDILTMLCPFDVDANLPTRDGETPFILACKNGDVLSARFLLDNQADPFILDRNDQSCLNIIAAKVRENPKDMRYAEVAQMVLTVDEVFSRECFCVADTIGEDINLLTEYVEDAFNQGLLVEAQEPQQPIARMSVSPERISYSHLDHQGPPPPPTSQPPVETLKKFSTLRSVGVEGEQDPEHVLLLEARTACQIEIEKLEATLSTLDSECQRDLEEESNHIAKKFKGWLQMEDSKVKVNKLKERFLSQGKDEEDALKRSEEVYHKKFLEMATKKVMARYEEKRTNFQNQLEIKKAELSSIEAKL